MSLLRWSAVAAADVFLTFASGGYSTLHPDTFDQPFIASRAHVVVLSLWQLVHEFGILYSSVMDGGMKLNVWLLTVTSAIVVSIDGM